MIATFYDLDGQEVESGQFSLITKSIYKAISDVTSMYSGKLLQMNHRAKWALIAIDKKRILISHD